MTKLNKEKLTEVKLSVKDYLSEIPPVIAETLVAEDSLERSPLKAMRFLLRAMIAFVIIVLLWATFSKVDVVVTATGKVVPSGKVKTIQAADAGVVSNIHVRDGQYVKQGDVLIELDTTSTKAENDQIKNELLIAELDVLRWRSVLKGDTSLFEAPEGVPSSVLVTQKALLESTINEHKQKVALLEGEIENRKAEVTSVFVVLKNLKSSAPLLSEKLESHRALFEEGFLSKEKLDEVQMSADQIESERQVQVHKLEQAKTALAKAKDEYEWAKVEHRKTVLDSLSEATKRYESLSQDLVKIEQRKGLQTIRSPIDGVVQQLAVNTIGGVVTQAQSLLVIVPDTATLEIEAKLLNKDIGSVNASKDVVVKIDAFDFTRYGGIPGHIDWVATDSVNDEALGEVFPIRVTVGGVTTPNSVNGQVGEILPGMSVVVDILIGKRRMIEYFMGPILRYKDESLRER